MPERWTDASGTGRRDCQAVNGQGLEPFGTVVRPGGRMIADHTTMRMCLTSREAWPGVGVLTAWESMPMAGPTPS